MRRSLYLNPPFRVQATHPSQFEVTSIIDANYTRTFIKVYFESSHIK
jgi:hypothetical protein